jgi:type II secretory pathway pseudopilin PulG
MRSSEQRLRQQAGYIMLMLLLTMAMLIIGFAIIAPTIAFEIKRDRDEELVHRGVQYTRAIRAFSKKTGRYPRQLEELRNTNGLRFIRKLYKDPITGKDFKLLHMSDIPVPGQTTPNLNSSDAQAGGAGSNGDGTAGGTADSNSANPAAPVQPPSVGNSGAASAGSGFAGSSSTGSFSTGSSSGSSLNGSSPTGLASASGSAFDAGQQPGLLIFGVASTSKAKSIREFDHKKHYNEWLFFYDPRYDLGYEIKGPTSLSMTGGAMQTQPGIPGAQNPGAMNPGSQNPGFQSQGFQNSGSQTNGNQSFGAPSSPSSPLPQQ